jgi:hypothetical protein
MQRAHGGAEAAPSDEQELECHERRSAGMAPAKRGPLMRILRSRHLCILARQKARDGGIFQGDSRPQRNGRPEAPV